MVNLVSLLRAAETRIVGCAAYILGSPRQLRKFSDNLRMTLLKPY